MEGLVAQGLEKWFKHRKVVDNVSLDIQRGEVVGLLGPNGAGKTTSFYMMVGLLPADRGRIFLEGQEITALPMYQRCRLGRRLPAAGVVGVPQADGRGEPPGHPRDARPVAAPSGASGRASCWPSWISRRWRRYPAYTLSGGERRRLEITRALVTSPQYLLLDEPFTGIDPIAIGDIQEIVGRLRERGIGILITDHNVRETLAITDRAYILYDGKILVSGTATRDRQQPGGPGDLPGRAVRALGGDERLIMAMETRLSLRQSQRVVMTPLLQQAIQLLQLSTLELQEVVQKELLENPLLEEVRRRRPRRRRRGRPRADTPPAPTVEPLTRRAAADERAADRRAALRHHRRDVRRRPRGAVAGRPGGPRGSAVREHRPLAARRSPTTSTSSCASPPRIRSSGGSGTRSSATSTRTATCAPRSRRSPSAAASTPDEVEKVLAAGPGLRSAGRGRAHHPGVPAHPAAARPAPRSRVGRDRGGALRRPQPPPLPGHRAGPQARRSTGSWSRSRRSWRLEPKPGRRFGGNDSRYIVPDVVVHKMGGEYTVVLNEDGIPRLRVNSLYRSLLRSSGRRGASSTSSRSCARPCGSSRAWTSASAPCARSRSRS